MNVLLHDPCCLFVLLGGGVWLLGASAERVVALVRTRQMRAVSHVTEAGHK